jgi:hypothetical protein
MIEDPGLGGREGHVLVDAMEACEDPSDVAVDRRNRLAVGDAGHRSRRIRADPREGDQGGYIPGNSAAVAFHNLLRSRVEKPGTAVVAQALPDPKNLIQGRVGQNMHRGEAGHEPLEVRFARTDGGLLEKDLRHQNGVGIACPTPR